MADSQTAAHVLRDLRRARGKSLRRAASDLGVSPGYLSRVERGEKTASEDLSARMASYYDVDPDIVALSEGRIPEDVVSILREHPEVLDRIRRQFGAAE